jgi:hypothetical protein
MTACGRDDPAAADPVLDWAGGKPTDLDREEKWH